MNKFDTISKIWNYFQGCSNSVQCTYCNLEKIIKKRLKVNLLAGGRSGLGSTRSAYLP